MAVRFHPGPCPIPIAAPLSRLFEVVRLGQGEGRVCSEYGALYIFYCIGHCSTGGTLARRFFGSMVHKTLMRDRDGTCLAAAQLQKYMYSRTQRFHTLQHQAKPK